MKEIVYLASDTPLLWHVLVCNDSPAIKSIEEPGARDAGDGVRVSTWPSSRDLALVFS